MAEWQTSGFDITAFGVTRNTGPRNFFVNVDGLNAHRISLDSCKPLSSSSTKRSSTISTAFPDWQSFRIQGPRCLSPVQLANELDSSTVRS